MPLKPGVALLEARVGDRSGSLCTGVRPRGVQVSVSVVSVGVELCASLDGVELVVAIFVGEGFGVDCRSGDGDAGLSGRRNGEVRGDP